MDEPTSSLDTSEVEVLFKVIEKLKRDKIAVIFITHRLDEVFATCDTVTILKDGKLVHRCKIEETNKLDMVSKMIGRNASDVMGQTKVCLSDRSPKEIFLEAKGMKKFPKVIEQSIKIRKGEVLGLAGLLGAGRTELARLLFGADTCKEGTIEIEGKPVKINTPRDAISNRIAFCSEDRKVEGIIPNMSISNNLTLACLKSISKWGGYFQEETKGSGQKYIEMLKIKIGNEKDPIISLSGGNQQKVLIARWLCANPSLLILDEPTRGIDVGAKQEILDKVCELSEQGMSVLVISSILEELVQTCDRIQVIKDGKTRGEIQYEGISEASIMQTIAKE